MVWSALDTIYSEHIQFSMVSVVVVINKKRERWNGMGVSRIDIK